jgi:hypothetical protein
VTLTAARRRVDEEEVEEVEERGPTLGGSISSSCDQDYDVADTARGGGWGEGSQ